MKAMKYSLTALLVVFCQNTYSQKDLSNYQHVDRVHITSYWGNIHAVGTSKGQEQEFSLELTHTGHPENPRALNETPFVEFKEEDNTLYVATRQPQGFESIDLNLKIPEHIFLEIKLVKGGEIYAENFKKGVEVNSLNGSVRLDRISDYALVNAANGEIVAAFEQINKKKPISLVTMNGGVTAAVPEDSRRDLRIISRKNGYVESDLHLESSETITNLNVKKYSKAPIIQTAKLNGGGALLFLSTENGPVAIKKSKY